MLLANLIGFGVGPQVVGILSDLLRPRVPELIRCDTRCWPCPLQLYGQPTTSGRLDRPSWEIYCDANGMIDSDLSMLL